MSIQSSLTALGDAIREKAETTETMTIDEMTATVKSIKTKYILPNLDYFCSNGRGAMYNIIDLENTKVVDLSNCFRDSSNLEEMDISDLKFSGIIDFTSVFMNCPNLHSVILPNTPAVISKAYGLFQNCNFTSEADLINLNIHDFSKCSDFRGFISGNPNLVSFDLSIFNSLAKSGHYVQNMFYNDPGLRKVWAPSYIHFRPGSANYSPFNANNGTNCPITHIFTDAPSKESMISAGIWSAYTFYYKATAEIPLEQFHFNATKEEYLSY